MERYATISKVDDQVELCRRFINTDRLSITKNQISPFTNIKVKKGTSEYKKTLENCDYIVKKEFLEKTKTSKVSNKMETVLSLLGSKMSQVERRNLLSAVPVPGVSQRTKKNLEVERNRELLKIPLFQKYNSPYPDGIAFDKMETEILPDEAYPIFLKYMRKGVPIPRVIEDLFDNPSDPKFYTKLLRVAIQQKVKLGEHLLSMIISNIRNDLVDVDQLVQYYKNVLQRPIPEDELSRLNIKYPNAPLEHQNIQNDKLFYRLMNQVKKLNPKLLKILLERYFNDTIKLIMIYYTLLRVGQPSQTKKIEEKLLNELKFEDLEIFINKMNSLESPIQLLLPLYVKLLSTATLEEIDLDVLTLMIIEIEDIDIKMDLLKLYNQIENTINIPLLSDVYGRINQKENVAYNNKVQLLKFITQMLSDESELQDFIETLESNYGITTEDLMNVIKDKISEFPEFIREYLEQLGESS